MSFDYGPIESNSHSNVVSFLLTVNALILTFLGLPTLCKFWRQNWVITYS